MSLNKRDALLVLLVGIFSIFFGKKITLSRDEPASTTSNNISQRRAGTETGDTLYDWAQWNSFVQNNAVERGYDVIGGATIRGGRAARDIRAGEVRNCRQSKSSNSNLNSTYAPHSILSAWTSTLPSACAPSKATLF